MLPQTPRFALFVALVVGVARPSAGATLHVPGGYPTLQAAIDVASPGDEIVVAPGTYSGPGNHTVELRGKSLHLRSEGGPDVTILDAQGSAVEPRRVFLIHELEGPACRIEGFTITGGWAPAGSPVDIGAGMFLGSASPTVEDCVFEGNHGWTGAGLAMDHSLATIRGCIFRANEGNFSPALDVANSEPTVEDCRVEGNVASAGAAVQCRIFDAAIFGRCLFLDNRGSGGGAFAVNQGYARLQDCVFLRNETLASSGRGTVAATGLARLVILRCTLADNDARGTGTVFAASLGGSSPLVEIDHSILGFDRSGQAVLLADAGASAALSCADLFGNAAGDWTGAIAGQLGVDGNFSSDPRFCDRPGGNVMLRQDSPCAPPGATGCGLVGALGVGCGPVALDEESWARIKARHRGVVGP